MVGEFWRTHLLEIINAMKDKESLNKKISLIDNMIFISEIIKFKIILFNEEKEKLEELKDDKSYIRDGGTSSTKAENIKDESTNKDDDSYIIENKNKSQELIYPSINIVFFKSLREKSKLKKNNNKFRVRIRFNRIRKTAIDRYIQKKDSMNPFDDSFNDKIIKYKKYDSKFAINVLTIIVLRI